MKARHSRGGRTGKCAASGLADNDYNLAVARRPSASAVLAIRDLFAGFVLPPKILAVNLGPRCHTMRPHCLSLIAFASLWTRIRTAWHWQIEITARPERHVPLGTVREGRGRTAIRSRPHSTWKMVPAAMAVGNEEVLSNESRNRCFRESRIVRMLPCRPEKHRL
jgi:hypothetical protein